MIQQTEGNTMLPKVYSIVVSSKRGTILHSGIYRSLDDAYISARKDLCAYTPHKDIDGVEIDFWTTMDIHSVLGKLGVQEVTAISAPVVARPQIIVEKTVSEQIKDVKQQKNVIMKNILLKKDLGLLKEAKPLFSKAEMKYIQEKLTVNK